MSLNFNYKLHQKVTYHGNSKDLKKSKLYAIVRAEYPNLYSMKPDEEIVLHIVDKFDDVIHWSNHEMREHFKARISEIEFQGDKCKPEDFSLL
ncbi:MAG: hypothetical protein HY015_10475 [Bacteroidetes bacterium]|nr:hypothetical protein [Bacteroidota bacterium]MBI3483373.1 hypothetical protein [Bacteroidota bacterium]